MKIGDLVRRTYGEGQRPAECWVRTYGEGRRPAGIIVGWEGTSRSIANVLWLYSAEVLPMGTRDLELVNETR